MLEIRCPAQMLDCEHERDCLEDHPSAGTPVLHWFSGSVRDLDRANGLGCWFSVGPAMLSHARGKMLAARMPRDRVLTESDGPFAQIDGRAVLPWEVERAVTALAGLWGCSLEEAQGILNANLRQLTQTLCQDSDNRDRLRPGDR